ncbi:MAG TPA: V-type ATP synthase subunit F [Anaeromyxobacteraceae bacterium]|nr:V-type ATP synthase subunit F [Anaeromyxobacteraceae bacterium]
MPEPRPPAPAAAAAHARTLRVVTRPGDALGLRLAGAKVDEVAVGDEAARLRALLSDPAIGVVAVESAVLSRVPEALLQRAAERGVPVVLPFALPRRLSEAAEGRAYVAALIRRAIGYHVKLEERR